MLYQTLRAIYTQRNFAAEFEQLAGRNRQRLRELVIATYERYTSIIERA
jgi:hypothetical protein